MRPHLRNSHINYHHGWFFITFQIHENKSELGAIVGDQCVLNPLGQAVAALIESLPRYNPEIYLDCYVVMPNHVHLILKIADSPYNSPNHLGKIVCKLKSLASKAYRDLKQQGKARDIGSHLWQENYWEKIITTYEQLQKIRTYIRTNPVNWSHDRFGEVTTYHLGNMNLLNQPLLAFVASQESYAGGDAPAPQEKNSRGAGPSCPTFTTISTFTSPQERALLSQLLLQEKNFIAVYPGGIPSLLPFPIQEALQKGKALLLSPVPAGTGLNKQRAIWCNEYLLRISTHISCGYIHPGGTLSSLLRMFHEKVIKA